MAATYIAALVGDEEASLAVLVGCARHFVEDGRIVDVRGGRAVARKHVVDDSVARGRVVCVADGVHNVVYAAWRRRGRQLRAWWVRQRWRRRRRRRRRQRRRRRRAWRRRRGRRRLQRRRRRRSWRWRGRCLQIAHTCLLRSTSTAALMVELGGGDRVGVDLAVVDVVLVRGARRVVCAAGAALRLRLTGVTRDWSGIRAIAGGVASLPRDALTGEAAAAHGPILLGRREKVDWRQGRRLRRQRW